MAGYIRSIVAGYYVVEGVIVSFQLQTKYVIIPPGNLGGGGSAGRWSFGPQRAKTGRGIDVAKMRNALQ